MTIHVLVTYYAQHNAKATKIAVYMQLHYTFYSCAWHDLSKAQTSCYTF